MSVLANSEALTALQRPSNWPPGGNRQVGSGQIFQEFRLNRLLFAGREGGLHAIDPDERDFKTGFRAHSYDAFERKLGPDQSFLAMAQQVTIKDRCFICHRLPGVYSFNSYGPDFRMAMTRSDGDKERPFPLSEMAVSEVAKTTVRWKESRPSWISLRSLLVE